MPISSFLPFVIALVFPLGRAIALAACVCIALGGLPDNMRYPTIQEHAHFKEACTSADN